jgi:hypothetical protein
MPTYIAKKEFFHRGVSYREGDPVVFAAGETVPKYCIPADSEAAAALKAAVKAARTERGGEEPAERMAGKGRKGARQERESAEGELDEE